MNIFIVNSDPKLAAEDLCDTHVCKMIVETTQILSTVSHRYKGSFAPYKQTHVHHPCTLWAGETLENWMWLLDHGVALAKEYTRRYGKIHKCQALLEEFVHMTSLNDGVPLARTLTPFALAMPNQYKQDDAVQAYRAFYIGEKARFARWNYCEPPYWWPRELIDAGKPNG